MCWGCTGKLEGVRNEYDQDMLYTHKKFLNFQKKNRVEGEFQNALW